MAKSLSLPLKLRSTLSEVLSFPVAPFQEQFLKAHLEARFSKFSRLSVEQLRGGNLLIKYSAKKGLVPGVCFQAHLDHPGFVVLGQAKQAGVYQVEALGGVPKRLRGERLEFFSSGRGKPKIATITRGLKKAGGKDTILVRSKQTLEQGDIGMWPFPPLGVKGDWLEGRAFDDTLQVGVLTYILEKACKERWSKSFSVLFTRAEEVGYAGAWELFQGKRPTLPSSIVTLEVPRAGGDVISGEGVVLRLGDSNISFDQELMLHLSQTANTLKKELSWFRSQRRLAFFGGTETTVFYAQGYKAGGLSIAVKNGHNINRTKGGKPAPERAHIADLLSEIALVEALIKGEWKLSTKRTQLKALLKQKIEPWRKYL